MRCYSRSRSSTKTGHAAGTNGILLETVDAGQTWKTYKLPVTVRNFSFADAVNGIAVTGSNDEVKLTHDGGEHWDDLAALNSSELKPFAGVLAVAALDKSHYLMIRRHPEVEDAFVVTTDGGKSWKVIHMQDDATNRVLAREVQVHEGEYWAFGIELVNRNKGGGHSVPLTMHSKDGENWTHGVRGPNEFGSCNSQGCYLWDGAVEVLYGEHERFWNLPQDGSLQSNWAIVGKTGCTVSETLKCGEASSSDKPQRRPEPPGGVYTTINRGPFADGCLLCSFDPISPDDPRITGRGPDTGDHARTSRRHSNEGCVGSCSQ